MRPGRASSNVGASSPPGVIWESGPAATSQQPQSYLARLRKDPQKNRVLCLDLLVAFCFLYSTADILVEWSDSLECKKAVGRWLMGSYVLICTFRVLRYIGQAFSHPGEEERVMHLRQASPVCRGLAWFTWLFLVPIFFSWTAMGSATVIPLVSQGRNACLPTGGMEHLLMRLLLCYGWVVMCLLHLGGILRFEYRLRRADRALHQIESDDNSQRRWGSTEMRTGFARSGLLKRGLKPEKIKDLPKVKIEKESPLIGEQCSICIMDFVLNDSVRALPDCRHYFHQECIDLWLLRSPSCPLCKCSVGGGAGGEEEGDDDEGGAETEESVEDHGLDVSLQAGLDFTG